jgi:hypothetical protein
METWDERNWHLALKAPNPVEAFREYQSAIDKEEDFVPIDQLPNKDWLRQT